MTGPRNIFLTGSTGLLGSHLLKRLIEEETDKIFLLVRGENNDHAKKRVINSLRKLYGPQYNEALLKKITIYAGDISCEKFNLESEEYQFLIESVNFIYHSAALTGFRLPLEMVRSVNVTGTKNVCDFASNCKCFVGMHYISTAFLVGDSQGDFAESDSIHKGQNFNNNYERSKYEAEILIENYKKRNINISIYRLSIISGEYRTGWTNNFKMFYEPLRFFSKNIFKRAPLNVHTLQNIIPVDAAAESIVLLSQHTNESKIYHIISPCNKNIEHFFVKASQYFGYINPEFVPVENFDMDTLTAVQKEIFRPFVKYLNYKMIFKSAETTKFLNGLSFKYPEIDDNYYDRLFTFISNNGYIKKIAYEK